MYTSMIAQGWQPKQGRHGLADQSHKWISRLHFQLKSWPSVSEAGSTIPTFGGHGWNTSIRCQVISKIHWQWVAEIFEHGMGDVLVAANTVLGVGPLRDYFVPISFKA